MTEKENKTERHRNRSMVFKEVARRMGVTRVVIGLYCPEPLRVNVGLFEGEEYWSGRRRKSSCLFRNGMPDFVQTRLAQIVRVGLLPG